jgi:hypothetical protein
MFVQFLDCLQDRLLLVLEGHKAFRQEDFYIVLQIDVFLHVFIDQFQIEFVGGNGIVEPGIIAHRINEIL